MKTCIDLWSLHICTPMQVLVHACRHVDRKPMSLPNIADVHGKMGLSASDSLGVSELLTHNKSVAFCSALGLDRGWQVLSFRPKAAYCMFLYSLPEGNDFHRLASEADMMIKVTHLKLKLAKMLSQRILPLSQEDAVTRKKKFSITIAFWICQCQ